jgi:beta-galactosidase/beta-glucuronidase
MIIVVFDTFNLYLNKLSMLKILVISFLIALAFCQSQLIRTDIKDNWVMSVLSGSTNIDKLKQKTYPTSIPTTAHLVLQAANDIPDPFLKENYPTLKYVSEINVLFATNFTISDEVFKLSHQQLVFDGIDTYSDIFLNGQKIISTENAFRVYKANVKSVLKQGTNHL